MAGCLREERREEHVAKLPPTVDEAAEVATRGAVREVELDLADVEAGMKRVDRHARLDAEAGGDRKHLGPCPHRERPLAGQGLRHAPSSAKCDQGPGDALRETETATRASGEAGDRDVCPGVQERPQIAGEICIAEEERALAAGSLGDRQGLTLAATGKRDDPRARSRGHSTRAVARAVVRDDDLSVRKRGGQCSDRRPDPILLVPRGDEHRQTGPRHPLAATGAGGGAGRIPSTAALPIP